MVLGVWGLMISFFEVDLRMMNFVELVLLFGGIFFGIVVSLDGSFLGCVIVEVLNVYNLWVCFVLGIFGNVICMSVDGLFEFLNFFE